MMVRPVKKLSAAFLLACLPLAASLAENSVGQKVPFIQSCSVGNFQGFVDGEYGITATGRYIQTARYKIVRKNGQQGGNKANLNLHLNLKGSTRPYDKLKSPDSLIQDGQWHTLVLGRNTRVREALEFKYEFIFDKSGIDPSCGFGKVF